MMSRFSSTDRLPLEKLSMACGPVSIASKMYFGLDAADLRRVAALRHRAARALEVVAGGAVGQEDLAAPGDRLLALLVGEAGEAVVARRSGSPGPGPSVATYAASSAISVGRVDDFLLRDLRPGLDRGHPAGADLEVDGGGADAGQRRAELVAVEGLDALAVGAVAERAADQEQLVALLGHAPPSRRLSRGGRRERGVQPAGQDQAHQDHEQPGDGAAAVPGETAEGAVQEAHSRSLAVT